MGDQIAQDIRNKLEALTEVNQAFVEVTFDPPWNPEMMTDTARNKLGFNPTPVPKNEPKIKTEWE